jgi:23S rRNA pseudouridine1911/1915/1917 synthase
VLHGTAWQHDGCHPLRYNLAVESGSKAGTAGSWAVDAAAAGVRLDKYLAAPERLGSRGRVTAALDHGKIFLNGREAARADAATLLRAGDVVRHWADRPGSAKKRLVPAVTGDVAILYEDDAMVVVNKPAGLLAVPLERKSDASSVYEQIEDHLRSRGKRRPFVVHRIDRDTSGLVIFAKSLAAQERLKDQFRRREPERVYLAIVYGHPDPPAGTWRDHLVWDDKALIQRRTRPNDPRGKEAISHYRVLESLGGASLVEVTLETGKRNQIRIQARLRGHTLVGEQRYVFGPDELRSVEFPRQALHAHRLGFRHPVDGRALTFEAPMPPDMAALLVRLRRARQRESPAGQRR